MQGGVLLNHRTFSSWQRGRTAVSHNKPNFLLHENVVTCEKEVALRCRNRHYSCAGSVAKSMCAWTRGSVTQEGKCLALETHSPCTRRHVSSRGRSHLVKGELAFRSIPTLILWYCMGNRRRTNLHTVCNMKNSCVVQRKFQPSHSKNIFLWHAQVDLAFS